MNIWLFENFPTPVILSKSLLSDELIVGNINENTNWKNALKDIDVVVHTAARVHIMKKENDEETETEIFTGFEMSREKWNIIQKNAKLAKNKSHFFYSL